MEVIHVRKRASQRRDRRIGALSREITAETLCGTPPTAHDMTARDAIETAYKASQGDAWSKSAISRSCVPCFMMAAGMRKAPRA